MTLLDIPEMYLIGVKGGLANEPALISTDGRFQKSSSDTRNLKYKPRKTIGVHLEHEFGHRYQNLFRSTLFSSHFTYIRK